MKLHRCLLLNAVAVAVALPSVSASSVASGRVFEDLNGDSIFNEGEPTLSGVPVSNGRRIVLTDANGAWNLDSDDDAHFFVMPRDGWVSPVDQNNLPQFYYVHKKHGSPDTQYPGHAPTGDLPESIDFPLQRSASESRFSVYVFGDPQAPTDRAVDYLARDVIAEVAGDTSKAFGLSLGDIAANNLSIYGTLNGAFGTIGLPWFNVIGNHDLNFDVPNDEGSDETYEAHYGPPTYAFQRGDAHFIILDDVVYHGHEYYEELKKNKKRGEKPYVGGLREDQFDFLQAYLELVPNDDLIIICVHIPIFQRQTSYYQGIETFRVADRTRLFELLKDYPNTLSLSAHTHFQKMMFFEKEDGWLGEKPHLHYNVGTTCGDWFKGLPTFDGFPDATMRDGTPNGYAILSIEGNQYDIRYKVAGADASKQMSLYVDYDITQDDLSDRFLYSNFYLGTEKTKAKCRFNRIDDWHAMEKSYEADPRSEAMYAFQQALLGDMTEGSGPHFKSTSKPHPCSHLWKIALPTDLEPGYHLAEVQMTDYKGRSYRDQIVFRVQ